MQRFCCAFAKVQQRKKRKKREINRINNERETGERAKRIKKNNKKLVLKVISAGSCLLYHTDFIISDSIVEEISNKYA